MAHEIEAAAADGLGALVRRSRRAGPAPGEACANCGSALEGPWCHLCGQSADDRHRSILRLTRDLLASLVDVDGRLFRTLPNLFFNPAKLTRDYLNGHRVVQAPPFRMFLIVVVLVFFALGGSGKPSPSPATPPVTPESHQGVFLDVTGSRFEKEVNAWMTSHITTAMAHPDAFNSALVSWSQRLSILALPMSALILSLLFLWRRGIYIFDHLIFSMHSLSFQGLLVSLSALLAKVSGGFLWLLALAPVHLFFHLKGTYGLGAFGTLTRMFVLFVGSLLGVGVIALGLLLIGLYEVGE